jgi:hypothetical protein
MKGRERLILGTLLLVSVCGGLTAWALGQAAVKSPAPQTRYLQVFFEKYLAALNSHPVDPAADKTAPFYAPNAVAVGAWGIERNNAERIAFECACGRAFPTAAISVKSLKVEPTTETSGTITWEFGIKSGKQVAPFLSVEAQYVGSDPNDPNSPFDQEGISIGEVEQRVDATTQSNIGSIQREIAGIDRDLGTLDAQIAGQSGQEKSASVERKGELTAKRARLDQTLTNEIVSTIKFTRHSSFENMDKFLRKLTGH